MDEKDVLVIVDAWRSEAKNINTEILALKRAAEIVGGDLLKHSIELWEMKSIRLQRCVIDLQGLVINKNLARMRDLETPNVELSGGVHEPAKSAAGSPSARTQGSASCDN